MKVKTLPQLLAEAPAEARPSIVGNKIVTPNSLCVFAAQPKVGKSLLMQQLALARELRDPWLGFPTEPGRTLYVNTEIAEAEFRDRFALMTEGQTLPHPSDLYVESILGRFENMTTALDLIECLVNDCRPDLLILDPVSQLLDGDDSKQEHVKAFLRGIDKLRTDYGVGVILVHHLRKPQRLQPVKSSVGQKPDIYDISGTGLWARNADTIIVGHGAPGGDEMTLQFTLRNGAAVEAFQIKRYPNLLWKREGTRPIPTKLATALKALGELGGSATNTEWEKAIISGEGCKERTAQRRIQDSLDGWVKKIAAGYSLTPDACEALGIDQRSPEVDAKSA